MGVVYKLKQEIVDFIIKQKQENPALSCRALAALIEESFQQAVSKSSINKILKTENLSSPVGRRGRKPKKSFKISENKKKELFVEASQHCILSDLNLEDGLVDCAGSIFLKSAEWELSREPVLNSIFKDYCSRCDKEKLAMVARVLGFLKIFNIESLEGLAQYSGKGLWQINGLNENLSENDFLDILDVIESRDEFFLKFSLKIPQFFTQVSGFRFILADGASFFIDGQGVCLWKNVQKGFPVSLGKAIFLLSKIFSGNDILLLNSISPKISSKNQDFIQIMELMGAFYNVQSKRIHRIEIIHEDGDVLGSFDHVPQIPRNLIFGLWPWEGLFQQFFDTKNVVEQGKIAFDVAGRDLSFKDVEIRCDLDGKKKDVRGILLFEPFMPVPFLILLTNVPRDDLSAIQIVDLYVQRWPNMEKSVNFSILSDHLTWKNDLLTKKKPFFDIFLKEAPLGRDPVWLAVDQFLFLLDRFCRRQFFPDTYESCDFGMMRNRFYSLPGKICEDRSKYVVYLAPPPEYPHLKELSFAAERLNESGVKTFKDQQVVIKI